MKRVEIKALFAEPERYTAEPVTVCGWVRTLRSSKALGFIELNDGSYFSNLQVVFEENKLANYDEISRQNVGAALGLVAYTQEKLSLWRTTLVQIASSVVSRSAVARAATTTTSGTVRLIARPIRGRPARVTPSPASRE